MIFNRSLIVELPSGEFECTIRVKPEDVLKLAAMPLIGDSIVVVHDDSEIATAEPEPEKAPKPRIKVPLEDDGNKPPAQNIGAGMGDTAEFTAAAAKGQSLSDFLNQLVKSKEFVNWASAYLHSKGAMSAWIETPSQVLNAYMLHGTDGMPPQMRDAARIEAVNRYIRYLRSKSI